MFTPGNEPMISTARPAPKVRTMHPLDEKTLKRVEDVLSKAGYRSLTNVRCELRGNSFVLTGTCPSFYLKQMAQELVRRIQGVENLTNEIEVWGRPLAGSDE